MKKLIHTIIVLSVFIFISSCAKMEVVNFNKDKNTRIIKFTFENGKTKIVNQKLHLKSNNWFEADCFYEVLERFKDCPDNKIEFTKVGKMQIAQLENRDSEEQSSSSKEQSSSSQEQSSSSQEQSSSSEEQNNSGPAAVGPGPSNPGEQQDECGSESC